jgi:hypothetical protein
MLVIVSIPPVTTLRLYCRNGIRVQGTDVLRAMPVAAGCQGHVNAIETTRVRLEASALYFTIV